MKDKKRLVIIIAVVAALTVLVVVYMMTNRIKSTPSEPDYSSIGGQYQLDDSQNYWQGIGLHDFTAAEDGYYYLTSDIEYLRYFDYQTKKSVLVCAKPECDHKMSVTCNAYMGLGLYVPDNIYYYNNSLYYMKYAGGTSILTRMDTDGSNRKEIGEIMPSGQDSSTHLVFHGDYAYAYYLYVHYGLDEEYTEVIKRISLKDGSTKDVFEVKGTNISVADVRSYGDKLYFLVQEQAKKGSTTSKTRGLYTYDYTTEEIKLVSDEDISDYCFITDKDIFAYYVSGSGLYFSDIKAQTTQLMIKADKTYDMCSLSYDGKYIYMNNLYYQVDSYDRDDRDKRCMVLNSSGEMVNEISCEDVRQLYFGDSRCMFAWVDSTGNYAYIDKNNIETVNTWTLIDED